MEHFGEGEADLLSEPFLDLKSPREHFDYSSDLGEANYSAVGDVPDVYLALLASNRPGTGSPIYLPREWHEVVLAKRKELNVFHDHHLIVVFVKHGAVHDGAQVLLVALCEEEHGLRIALWGIKQALSVGVLAHAFQYRPYSARQLGQAFLLVLLGRLLPLKCSSTLNLLVSL